MLNLNQDISLGRLDWSGLFLEINPGSPSGKLTVNNLGGPATWRVYTPAWCWLDADLVLEDSLTLSNAVLYRETEPVRLNGLITGPGRLTLQWSSPPDGPFYIGAPSSPPPNTYTGGTRLEGDAPNRGHFEPRKNGAFGPGDVTLNGYAKLILRDRGASEDYIADTAALRLETIQITNRANVYLASGVNETVATFWLDGVQQPAGTYGATGSGAGECLDDFFAGPGLLTVTTGPPNPGALRNLPPLEVTATSVTFAGEVLAMNTAPSSVQVFWGLSDGGRQRGAWDHCATVDAVGLGMFSLSTNYTPTGQTIYYRCLLTNALGSKWADGCVTFGPAPVRNELPWVHTNRVTLRATVLKTNHLPTQAAVFWDTNDAGVVPENWQHRLALGPVAEGPLATNLSGWLPGTRYYYRFWTTNLAGVTWASPSMSFTVPAPPAFGDITFLVGSDLHYGYTAPYPGTTTDLVNRRTLDNLNAVAGQPYPASVGGATVGLPRGVLLIGDLTETGSLSQWISFTNDWGVNGDQRCAFPVYEAFGNHDYTSVVLEGIRSRNLTRAGRVNVSTNGYHYSWDWDFLHVVCLNLFPGNAPDVYGFDPKSSLQFLAEDLAANVGSSRRPVILYHHFGFDPQGAASWSGQPQTNYFETIKDYNVVAILAGHNHYVDFFPWRGIDTWTDGSVGKWIGNFLVARVTWTNLTLLERSPSNTWQQSFSKPITVPLPAAPKFEGVGLANGLVNLTIRGPIHWVQTIETSTNLRDWLPLHSTNAPTQTFRWTDTQAAGYSTRFYRVRLGP